MTFNLKHVFGNGSNDEPDAKYFKMDRPMVVNGIRVSLGEIESIINQQPEIKDSRIVAHDAGTGQPRLIAYVIPRQSVENERQFQQHLRHILPMHLLPEQFVLVDAIPHTSTGEVDDARLPVPELEFRSDDRVSQSRGERFLIKLWKELLQNDTVSPDDDFFQVGGNAAHAEFMLARIESSTGIKILPTQLQEHSTLRALAALLDQARPLSTSETSIELRPGQTRPLFLIPAAARTSLSALRYVSRIKPGLRVVGIEYPRELPAIPPARRVPTLAGYFAGQIRSIQPQGPYSLVGNCMGGTLVYETAQQLINTGQRVEHVIMIDSGAPVLQSKLPERDLGYYLERFAVLLQKGKFIRTIRSRLSRWYRPVRRLNMDTDVRKAIKYLWDAKNAYRTTTRYDGRMLVILNSLSHESQRTSDWKKVAPNAELHYIDETDHHELFRAERSLEAIGQLMTRYLEEDLPSDVGG